jgi:1-acyl-sn-glycerol-3-phosphate acyltransferase
MTAAGARHLPPTADEVERRLRHPAVIVTRPIILGGIGVLSAARSFQWRATGRERLRDLAAPIILAANHQSHADTAAILGTLPRELRDRTVVAAALDVFGNGSVPSLKREFLQLVVAAGFRAFGFDRHGSPMRSLRTAAQLVRNGWNLLLFPEGTRSRTGEIAHFKAGISVLARFTRRPIVPVHVAGGRSILPCGGFFPRPGRILVRYGRPMRYGPGDTLEGFASRVEDAVRQAGVAAPGAG